MLYNLKPKGWKRVFQTELSRHEGPVLRKQKASVAGASWKKGSGKRGGEGLLECIKAFVVYAECIKDLNREWQFFKD